MLTKHFISAALVSSLAVACSATVTTNSGTCSQDSSVSGCSGASTGYSCGGSDSPDQTDATLSCSYGILDTSTGDTLYCCLASSYSWGSSSCAVDNTVTGCTSAGSYGYSCTAS